MNFEYKDGKCIVLRKDMENCLVLPKGTYSLSRDTFLSKEGFAKLKENASREKVKEGVCCINRQKYDECYVIPVGVLHPKVPMLLSHAALSGIGGAMAKTPKGKEEPVLVPTPPPQEAPEQSSPEEIVDTPPEETTQPDETEGEDVRTEKRVKPDES